MPAIPPAAAGFVLSLANFVAYIDAYNERAAVVGATTSPLPAADATVSSSSSGPPASSTSTFGIGWLQDQVLSLTASYADPSLIGNNTGTTGLPGANWKWTEATWRAAAGHAHTNAWRRSCPRSITSTSATSDTEGNSAATGQRAFLTSDGKIYRCVTSGSWTLETVNFLSMFPQCADVLDSTASAPDHCSPGRIAAGDHLRWFHFEEIRNGLLQFTKAYISPIGNTFSLHSGNASFESTASDAKTTAESGYDGAPTTGTNASPSAYGQQSTDGFGRFYSQLEACTVTWDRLMLGTVLQQLDIWVFAHPITGFGFTIAFDSNGTGVSADQWNMVGSPTAAGGSHATYPFGIGASHPAWCPDPMFPPGGANWTGFRCSRTSDVGIITPTFSYT